MSSLQLWGEYECTVNRVRDSWHDQTILGGHQDRIDDLQLFADLGMTSLRYPALWERIAPDHPDRRDFRWTDERLAELRRLGINPIVTLCHHGSGPHYTSLVDPSFAPGLAAHAAAVAERYPWLTDGTPVNEPLTTARFSALYGYWYPHTKDEGLFWTALLNEIDATRLAMREIRKVNPAARLIQTDDLGYCDATEPLQTDADYQNERRWIGWDLLCGMVVPGHALWERLAGFGLAERLRLRWFVEVWEGAEELRRRGVDLCAITAWSLLGSHDWNRMVTHFIGHYETGVYDVRTGKPLPTRLVSVLQDLAAGRRPDVPAMAGPGWWRRDSRLIRAAHKREPGYEVVPGQRGEEDRPPLLIVGDGEELTRLAVRACEMRGLTYARADGDANAAIALAGPWAVLDARDHGRICSSQSSNRACSCDALARACVAQGVPSARITSASSWARFDALPGLLEIRTGRIFLPWDRTARPVRMLEWLETGAHIAADANANFTHVYGPDIMDLTLDLLIDGMEGAVNVAGERMTELDFARTLAVVADCDPAQLVATGNPAERPLFDWKGPPSWLPPFESSLERFVREARAARRFGQLAVSRRRDEPHLEQPEHRRESHAAG